MRAIAFSADVFKPASHLVCAWESKFGMEDGTLQMHLHMMAGINLRNTKLVVVDADWDMRAWAKLCYSLMMDLSFLNPQGHKMRILLSDIGIGTMNMFEAMHTYMQRAVGSLPEKG